MFSIFLDLADEFFRRSDHVLLSYDNHLCQLSIPKTENVVHYVQFRKPLTAERRFFFVELKNISEFTSGVKTCRFISPQMISF